MAMWIHVNGRLKLPANTWYDNAWSDIRGRPVTFQMPTGTHGMNGSIVVW